MAVIRKIQLTALALTLLAGFLWSQKYAKQLYDQQVNLIQDSSQEQVEMLRSRIDAQTDPIRLLDMGQTFLSSHHPDFAIVALEKATELKPDLRDGWYLLGYSHIEASNQISPDTTNAALTSRKAQHLAKARAALLEAHQLDANHEPTNQLLNQLN